MLQHRTIVSCALILIVLFASKATAQTNTLKEAIWNEFQRHLIAADKSKDPTAKDANVSMARWHALNYASLTSDDALDERSILVASFLRNPNARLVAHRRPAHEKLGRLSAEEVVSAPIAGSFPAEDWPDANKDVFVDRRSFVGPSAGPNGASPPADHTITFSAVEGFPGHAFIVVKERNPKTKKVSTSGWGFYGVAPKDTYDIQYVVQSFPGLVMDELMTGNISLASVKLTIAPNEADYDAAIKVVTKWQKATPRYRLLWSDCVEFIEEIGKAMNLEMPPRLLHATPQDYVGAMIEKLAPPAKIADGSGTSGAGTAQPPAQPVAAPPATTPPVGASNKEKPEKVEKHETIQAGGHLGGDARQTDGKPIPR